MKAGVVRFADGRERGLGNEGKRSFQVWKLCVMGKIGKGADMRESK